MKYIFTSLFPLLFLLFSLPSQAQKSDKSSSNLALPKMIKVEGGTFVMGSEEGGIHEKPIREASVSTFFLAETEITFDQFQVFVGATRYKTDAEKRGWADVYPYGERYSGVHWRCDEKGKKRSSSSSSFPVIFVSWNDAVAYCQWLSWKTGKTYRLPTATEWEYAAGGGASKRTMYAGTDAKDDLKSYAVIKAKALAPTKSKKPNSLGLYDMSGNVWEWCSDSIKAKKSGESTISVKKVLRGGAWDEEAFFARVSSVGTGEIDGDYYSIGFRVVMEP